MIIKKAIFTLVKERFLSATRDCFQETPSYTSARTAASPFAELQPGKAVTSTQFISALASLVDRRDGALQQPSLPPRHPLLSTGKQDGGF